MKEYGNYIMGTPYEIAEHFVSQIVVTEENDLVIPELTMKHADYDDDNLEQLYKDSGPYFGIKEIHTGFDNWTGADLFCDYYGGGQGSCCYIEKGDDKRVWINDIKSMIASTMRSNNILLICKYEGGN